MGKVIDENEEGRGKEKREEQQRGENEMIREDKVSRGKERMTRKDLKMKRGEEKIRRGEGRKKERG